jgi:hypothetical protein
LACGAGPNAPSAAARNIAAASLDPPPRPPPIGMTLCSVIWYGCVTPAAAIARITRFSAPDGAPLPAANVAVAAGSNSIRSYSASGAITLRSV